MDGESFQDNLNVLVLLESMKEPSTRKQAIVGFLQKFHNEWLNKIVTYDEVKDLEHSLMAAYQDYDSLVESEIIIKNDWDERR